MRRPFLKTAAVVSVFALFITAESAMRMSARHSVASTADEKAAIPYFIADGSGKTGYRSSDRELARWALEAWQRSSAKGLRFAAAPESSALIQLYWAEPSEGEYGEMRPLIVGGQRGAAVFIRPDVESLGADIARRATADVLLRDTIVYLTCLHEFGHALGLAHTRDFRDIMYYFGYGGDISQYFGRYRAQLHSRSDIAAVSGLSDADAGRIKALYQPE